MVVDRRQRVAALGRGAVGVLEVHLHELAGDEIQRLAVVTHERQVRDRRREHAPAGELEGKALDGGQEIGRCVRSEEHTSELKSIMRISYAVFCLKNKHQMQSSLIVSIHI